ncbi:DUF6002 family protein [Actinoallomurus rhizosphaericola]|uniref:DUF6002 family protein n=1 Tax=Actinoallomurus rhizosphaericola TaxID=2952536 RepID=UPI0020933B9D|nr:DUF6002 family protein [Actinoallomurus rhizosphaericola]MCO5997988.1 DUF6002 family protein [Actinoallomurus rhizosphaericola]
MILENALAHYYPEVGSALSSLIKNDAPILNGEFDPGNRLPELTDEMVDYLSASTLACIEAATYDGKRISFLDLTRHSGTQTTKTFASLMIVARAVRFIQDSGLSLTIVTPSSANKAVALRDAVLRAIKSGLVRPDQLNIIALVPAGSVHKLRRSELFTDQELRTRNPLAVYPGPHAETVKHITRAAVDRYRQSATDAATRPVWYTLKLENYLVGDIIRAFAESDALPPAASTGRLHVHAVSSAFGLLGHDYGRSIMTGREAGPASRYFLVQHLGAPDMVTSLYDDGSGDPQLTAPTYTYQPKSGCYTQETNPHFPRITFDPKEVLDTTFYTRNPVTSPRMNEIIRSQGGGGIVVSLAECLERYGEVRAMCKQADIILPANPTLIQEWSLNMAMTGLMNAIDRGLIQENEILVHCSGTYTRDDYEGLAERNLPVVTNEDELVDLMHTANASSPQRIAAMG